MAEILLTDLPPAALDRGTDLAGVSGCIVQIRMFLNPSPGDTPIAKTAVNSSIRQIVISGGAIGVYSGGGFVLPRDRPGDARFRANVRDATLRLTGVSGAFVDRLGPANFNATLAPVHDESAAHRIGARVEEIMRRTHASAAPARQPAP